MQENRKKALEKCLQKKSHKILAWSIGVLMLLVFVYAQYFIISEQNHDCSGEECPICSCIRQCDSVLHQFSNGALIQVAVVLSVLFLIFTVSKPTFMGREMTLVSVKVRLDL